MDPVKIQHEIRSNAEELQDFLRDLRQWKQDMKRKELELNEQIFPEDEELPPIRGHRGKNKGKISVVSKNKKNREKSTEKKVGMSELLMDKPKRISSSDYAAWEKFDVERACDDLDKETGDPKETDSAEEETSDNEDFETEYQKDQAIIEKEKGNEFFHMGKLEQAIECYTRGMLCDPMNPFLPANRALALLKKEMFAAAEQDCDLAIAIDTNYVKAFQRRGTARAALKKFSDAREDFNTVLRLEPGNRQALIELSRLCQVERDMEMHEKEKQKEEAIEEEPLTNPRRVQITEINTEEETKDSSGEVSPVEGLVQPIAKPPHLRSKRPLKRISVDQTDDNTLQCMKEMACGDGAVSSREPDTTSGENGSAVAAAEDPAGIVEIPSVPRTSYQFQSDWKKLRKSPEQLFEYFKQIPVDNYGGLFQKSLESDVLSDVLRVFRDFYIRNELDVFSPLTALTQVERFQTLKMFLSVEDRKVLQEIFAYLQGHRDPSDVATLLAQYGL